MLTAHRRRGYSGKEVTMVLFFLAGNLTIPSSPEGFGFEVIGGNAVGQFVSEVNLGHREVSQGVQILQINGKDAWRMSHYEATHG